MEYQDFLDYAFPIFGIAALTAFVCWLPMKLATKPAPGWLAALTFYGFLFSVGVMLIVGWFLPWGSPY